MCERRNKSADTSGTSTMEDFDDGGENQRHTHTNRKIAATHAEYIQIRKFRPDAFPNSGFM